MALSMLEDVQTARGIAAALAGMKSEENCNISSQSGANTNSVYSGLHSAAAASALGMLSPQLFAANRAAAIMAAGFPVSTLASMTTLFPPHAALFPTWHQTPGSMHPHSAGQHSPPESPISPLSASKKTNHNNNNITSSNSNLITATSELLSKKLRKPNLKRERSSPVIDIHSNNTDIFSPGPISPPSSDSSPNSNHDPSVLHTAKDPSRDKCFTCKICNRSFGYKHVLQNHERTHTGEKPFECPECHKRFTRDHHLKTHMRLHTGEKPYHCNHCDRQFVQVANLRRHLRVHTGERPYTCEMCDAKFSDSNQLKSHILIHNGEKPFNCDRCHLKFRRRHHLMHHKCGIQSPPTPAISPTMSDVAMSDQKSPTSSSTFDDCGDISKSNHRSLFDMPLDLSEDGNLAGVVFDCEKRSGKSKGRPRLVRLPQQILHVPTSLPEQTEPEDLSMHSPRSRSPLSVHHEDDLEDLDDAATLYLKQQRQRLITDQITPIKVRD